MRWPVWSWSIAVTSASNTALLITLPVLKLNTCYMLWKKTRKWEYYFNDTSCFTDVMLTICRLLLIKNGNTQNQHIPTKKVSAKAPSKYVTSQWKIEIGNNNILTLTSLFALPTERKLLFTCTKDTRIFFNSNKMWMQEKIYLLI